MAIKHTYYRIRHRGFTIIECLFGLAISAMLLTAVAVAFNASAINFRENEDLFRTMNNARQALTRMTAQLRTGHAFDLSASANQCIFYAVPGDPGVLTTYEYRNDEQKLYLIQNGTDYVLCNNVTAATFTKTLNGASDDYKSVLILLTVQSGGSQRTLAAAAVIRRNL